MCVSGVPRFVSHRSVVSHRGAANPCTETEEKKKKKKAGRECRRRAGIFNVHVMHFNVVSVNPFTAMMSFENDQ